MEKIKYRLRCRFKGVLVTSNPKKFDVVWKRVFNPKIYPEDAKYKR